MTRRRRRRKRKRRARARTRRLRSRLIEFLQKDFVFGVGVKEWHETFPWGELHLQVAIITLPGNEDSTSEQDFLQSSRV
jgi:hypothetical protein